MRRFIIILVLSISSIAAAQEQPLLAVAVFVKGNVYFQRGKELKPVKLRTIFHVKDTVITKKGRVNIQIGKGAIIRMTRFTSVKMTRLLKISNSQKIDLDLQKGQLYSKIIKKLDKDSNFNVKTPTVTAAVRGTEFIVSEVPPGTKAYDISKGVYVNVGSVAVNSEEGDESAVVNQGEQLDTSTAAGYKKQILTSYMKEKMRIFHELKLMKEKQYEMLREQHEKNRNLIDQIKDDVQQKKGEVGE